MVHIKKLFTGFTLQAILVLLVSEYLLYTYDLLSTGPRLDGLAREWEAHGPQATVTGRLRDSLAALTWLGPLRPHALRDPFKECGVPRASNGWWSGLVRLDAARRRLACLEAHMVEARVEHGLFEERLRDLCLLVALAVACIASLLAEPTAEEDELAIRHGEARQSGHVQSSSESSGSSFEMIEAPPDGAGRSLSREVVLLNAPFARLKWSWRRLLETSHCSPRHVSRSKKAPLAMLQSFLGWPLETGHKSPRRVSRHKWLKIAMKHALIRQMRRRAGKPVGYMGLGHDSLDWWRGDDDGTGKLVIQAYERRGEMFRPYRYPTPPRLKSYADPFEVFPRREQPLSLNTPQVEQSQDVRRRTSVGPACWEVLLQALSVLMLGYLLLNDLTR